MSSYMYIESGKIDKDDFMSRVRFKEDAVTFGKCIETIIDKINEAEDERAVAIKKLDEWNRDKELEKIRQEIETIRKDMYRGFSISEKEKLSINNWIRQHEETKHSLITDSQKLVSQGCCGGVYTYEFIPTSIGTIGRIKCHCGDSFDFQEL